MWETMHRTTLFLGHGLIQESLGVMYGLDTNNFRLVWRTLIQSPLICLFFLRRGRKTTKKNSRATSFRIIEHGIWTAIRWNGIDAYCTFHLVHFTKYLRLLNRTTMTWKNLLIGSCKVITWLMTTMTITVLELYYIFSFH